MAGPTYTPSATASSGLAVAITVDASSSSVCSITAGAVSFQTVGTCVVDFDQDGNADYTAAPQVQQLRRGPGLPDGLRHHVGPDQGHRGGATYTPAATAASGLTVAITVDASASAVCSITAGVVSFQTVGTCVSTHQAGNADYLAAPGPAVLRRGRGGPGAPTIGTAVAGSTNATVTWTAPTFTGGEALTGYVITPCIGTTAQTPVHVGVVPRTWSPGRQRDHLHLHGSATNAVGTGAPSAHTNTVTPPVAQVPGPTRPCPHPDLRHPSGTRRPVGPAAQCNGTATPAPAWWPTPRSHQRGRVLRGAVERHRRGAERDRVNPSPAGYLSIYPTGAGVPTAPTSTWRPASGWPTWSRRPSGSGGQVSIVSNTSMDVAVDLEGYVSPTGLFGAGPLQPAGHAARICDTRAGNPSGLSGGAAQCNGTANAGERLAAGGVLTVTVDGNAGVPSTGVSAVVLNVTAVNPAAAGYLTAYPRHDGPHGVQPELPGGGDPAQPGHRPGLGRRPGLHHRQPGHRRPRDVSGWYSATSGTGTQYTPGAAPVRVCDTRRATPRGSAAPRPSATARPTPARPSGPGPPGSSTWPASPGSPRGPPPWC